ncbi:MAG: tetratricopeptide repeat protein [Mangrovibacterium sp.]
MNQTKFRSLLGLALATTVLSSCAGLKSMQKNADDISFNVDPAPLEAHAGEVKANINGVFPEKYFAKKVTLEATPVLTTADGKEVTYEKVTVQGEKVKENNNVIDYKKGGDFDYSDAVAYDRSMRESTLSIHITATKGKKSVDFEPIPVADGVLSTAELAMKTPQTIVGIQREENTTGVYDANIDPYQRIVPESYSADIMYLKNQASIRSSEQKAEDIVGLAKYTQDVKANERKALKDVKVSAYASPEGEVSFNTKLSENRKNSGTKVVDNILKKSEIETSVFSDFTAEDWDGFQELMEASTIQDKDLILRVLSMYTDPEVREEKIRSLGEVFTDVQDEILPQLRRAKITANVDVTGRSDQEILAQFKSDASLLNPAELIYGASLVEADADKVAFYEALVKYYPNDWRGYNNIGVVAAKGGDYDKAKGYFTTAEQKDNTVTVVKNNLAACEIAADNNAEAKVLLGAASGAGDAVNYNSAIIAIEEGEYATAAKLLAGTNTVNEAVAKILSGDADGALRALNNSECKCWKVSYFKAVVSARMAKESAVYTNLKEVVAAHPEAKELIATDVEFAQYKENAEFQAIVK